MKSRHAQLLNCPLCQVTVIRIRRSWLDRLLGLVAPVARYRCASALCSWQGLLRRPRIQVRGPYHGRHVLEPSSTACTPAMAGTSAQPAGGAAAGFRRP